MSCVLLVSLGDQRLLLTGDISAADEAGLIARVPSLRARLLAVPHHGSRFSTTEQLLEAVRPDVAFIQAGYLNRFGHPHPDVIARLTVRSVETARTDLAGALHWRLKADGSIRVQAWREQARRYWHDDNERQATSGGKTKNPERGRRDTEFTGPLGQGERFEGEADTGIEPIVPH